MAGETECRKLSRVKPRDKRAIAVLVSALLVFLIWQWQANRYSHPANVRNVVLDLRSADEDRRMEAKNALSAMGTNAVPFLWTLYTATHPTRRFDFWRWRWVPISVPPFRNWKSKERSLGFEGLRALGPQAVSISSSLVLELKEEPRVGGRPMELLMSIGPAALPAITSALTDSSPHAKEMLLSVIGHYRSGAAPALVDVVAAIHDPNDRVRRAAASAIAQIQGFPSLSVPALTLLLRDPNAENREMAMHALSAFGTNASPVGAELRRLAPVIPLDHPERVASASLLISLRDVEQARVEVLNLLESTNPTNRLWALTHLTELPVPFAEIGQIASRFLGDPDAAVRLDSAKELGQAARETGYPEELINAGLGAGAVELRLAFLEFAWKPDPASLPLTMRALADPDARVCRAAAVSLTGPTFSTKPAQPALAALLNHAEPSVRRDAYHALHNSDSKLFPMLVPWPLNTPTERTVNTLARLHLLGPAAVADTNQLAAAVGRLPQPFAPLAGALTASGRMNLIPGLKSMLTDRQELGRQYAAETLVELGQRQAEARDTVLELLRATNTPPAALNGLKISLGIQRSVNMPLWLELAESAPFEIRREGLLRIVGSPGGNVEKVVPILLKATRDSDRRISDLATGLLRQYPAEQVDKYRAQTPHAPR